MTDTREFDSLMKKFQKKFFARGFWKEVGAQTHKDWTKHIFTKELTVRGKKFPEYSNEYREMKRAGKLSRQALAWKNSVAPVASGDLMGDFGLKKILKDGFTIGTISYGARLRNLNKMKREISVKDQVIPKDIEKMIMNATKSMGKKLLGKSTKNIITIGD
tara:strand:- start:371 stop:853 length:483 start_codon:yes stop_codon:yes gene_type:complete